MKVHADPFRRGVISYAPTREHCLYFIKICAYSYVTVIPTAVIDYQINVTLISILIMKAIDSSEKLKKVLFSVQFTGI